MDVSPLRPAAPAAASAEAGAPERRETEREEALRRAATAFEAAFLAEMLKHAGAGRSTPGFDGGAGEAAFGQELVRAQAEALAEQGGIGLAERLFQSMLQKGALR